MQVVGVVYAAAWSGRLEVWVWSISLEVSREPLAEVATRSSSITITWEGGEGGRSTPLGQRRSGSGG